LSGVYLNCVQGDVRGMTTDKRKGDKITRVLKEGVKNADTR